MLRGQTGISYIAKVDDHMDKVIVRGCPTCGAKKGELCIMRSGKRVTQVQNVHSARFKSKDEKKRKIMADHYAAI